MGSPLGPLLADIFLTHLENETMQKLKENGLVFYKRYVDDIFAIVKEESNVDQLQNILNSFHTSIQFTIETEKDTSLPFLDILIRRLAQRDQSWFATSIYRKSTFTDLLLKWKSFIPYEYKKSAISSMVYRALRISSNYLDLHKEFLFIRQLGVSNGYPLSFVQNIIRTTFERYRLKSSSRPSPATADPSHCNNNKKESNKQDILIKQVHLIDIPYVGCLTTSYGKKLINLAKPICPQVYIQPIPRPFPSVQAKFPRKDRLPKELTFHLVYNINCKDCSASYIGKIFRQPERRFAEHGKPKDIRPKLKSSTTNQLTTLDPIRRSTRKKNFVN